MHRPLALALLLLASSAGAESVPSAQQIADRLQSRFERVHDYRCEMEVEVHGTHESKHGVYRLWYLKPDRVRLKVIHGDDSGSELATTADGKARGRAGGMAHIIPAMTLSKTDSRLKSPSGRFGWECDFGTYNRWLKERLSLSSHPQVVPAPDGNLRLTLEYTDPARRVPVREEWLIHAADWLLLSVTISEKDKVSQKERLVEQVQFRGFQQDTGLTLRDMDLR